jgi:hypothetical protein
MGEKAIRSGITAKWIRFSTYILKVLEDIERILRNWQRLHNG